MSRTIDKLPENDASPTVKLVVASCSRTATLGVYQALKILGYKPYHMYEMAMSGGDTHWEIMMQGFRAQGDRWSGVQRYTKREFDKWFAGYDALVEVPSYFDTAMLESYLLDPNVKFILTERTPESWARSFNGFIGDLVTNIESPPMNILRHFNRTLNYFCLLNIDVYDYWSDGTRPGDPRNEGNLGRNYEQYISRVKRLIPPDRMLVVKLEDGLGWEQICPFLGKPVPKGVTYPKGVEHTEVKDKLIVPLVRNAMMKLALTVTVPIALGATVWWKWSASR
ncbi:hypothetical protein AYL99_11074 [Fonsecaea erecta]|uniref:Sulfotransferase domain-containing protein n=1 Tax=Fonsecaea erecta TaxID=1367422 RepID=A0A178Z586_9EURO|nr:hypothetical protein AYL99_11074 [Fonsecaea erecta]OAP54626.1 hypothetical protein AYL99_11074 [Fonsecaea erecta]